MPRGRLRQLARGRPRARPTFEIHVPISPTPAFLLRVKMLAASLRRFSDVPHRLVVTVSRDHEPYDIAATEAWAGAADIEWRWVAPDVWERHGIFGTAIARFAYTFETPFVLMLDADVLCTGSLSELPGRVGEGLGGVMAWNSPLVEPMEYRDGRARTTAAMWTDLFEHAGLRVPPLDQEHPAFRIYQVSPDHRTGPAYFNLGLLAAPAAAMTAVGRDLEPEMELVDAFARTRFRCQLAVSLAGARCGVPLTPLPLRFNHPNNAALWDAHPDQNDVRILHYTDRDQVDREALDSAEAIDALMAREDLNAPNRLLRDTLRAALDGEAR